MRFLNHDGLKEKGITYSRPQIWRLIKAGRFPPPVKGLGNQNVWPEPEIDAVIAKRLAERDGEAEGAQASHIAETVAA
jgi:prophage regulatory protein